MRALVDANVFISYLLSPDSTTPPVLLTEAAISEEYVLLSTDEIIAEIRRKTSTKPDLAHRISPAQTTELVALIRSVATWIPKLEPPLPKVGHDRKDDYLFAHAMFGEADCLVSGDGGVREIKRIGDVRILSPAEFVAILDTMGDPA